VTIGEVFELRHADPQRLRTLLDQAVDLHGPLAEAVAARLRRAG